MLSRVDSISVAIKIACHRYCVSVHLLQQAVLLLTWRGVRRYHAQAAYSHPVASSIKALTLGGFSSASSGGCLPQS